MTYTSTELNELHEKANKKIQIKQDLLACLEEFKHHQLINNRFSSYVEKKHPEYNVRMAREDYKNSIYMGQKNSPYASIELSFYRDEEFTWESIIYKLEQYNPAEEAEYYLKRFMSLQDDVKELKDLITQVENLKLINFTMGDVSRVLKRMINDSTRDEVKASKRDLITTQI